jgi:hypothetical protein
VAGCWRGSLRVMAASSPAPGRETVPTSSPAPPGRRPLGVVRVPQLEVDPGPAAERHPRPVRPLCLGHWLPFDGSRSPPPPLPPYPLARARRRAPLHGSIHQTHGRRPPHGLARLPEPSSFGTPATGAPLRGAGASVAVVSTRAPVWLKRASASRRALVALDADTEGDRASDGLRRELAPFARSAARLQPPARAGHNGEPGKDWNDALQADFRTLREWLQAALASLG